MVSRRRPILPAMLAVDRWGRDRRGLASDLAGRPRCRVCGIRGGHRYATGNRASLRQSAARHRHRGSGIRPPAHGDPEGAQVVGLLLVVCGILAVSTGAYVAFTPTDRYVDFAAAEAAPNGQLSEVTASLTRLFEVSNLQADPEIGLYVVTGGGHLAAVGGLIAFFGRRASKAVEGEPAISEPLHPSSDRPDETPPPSMGAAIPGAVTGAAPESHGFGGTEAFAQSAEETPPEATPQVRRSRARSRAVTPLTVTLTPPPLGGVRVRVAEPSARIFAKADRLLTTGAVCVLEVGHRRVLVEVVGDHGRYRVTFDDRWRCTCPAVTYCSHAIATAKVVHRESG